MIYETIIHRTPIEKGWSGDRKYCAVTEDGNKYLLRVSPPDRYDRRKQEFMRMKQLEKLGINMPKALELGTTEEGVYILTDWIDGEDAEDALHNLSPDTQYRYGLDAGRMLQKLHSFPAPSDAPDWEQRFNAKIDRKIAMYEACPLHYEMDWLLLEFLAENRKLLANRPQTYQHGDYHTGNMMIGRDEKLYIIDFDRDDYGDPWEEFNRIVWCAQAAPVFAAGLVDGYFGVDADTAVPMEFWRLLALYISSNMLSSIPWAIPFGEGEIQTMLRQADDVLSWYDNMKNPVPTWYDAALSHKK